MGFNIVLQHVALRCKSMVRESLLTRIVSSKNEDDCHWDFQG